jgi:hypothetical protein
MLLSYKFVGGLSFMFVNTVVVVVGVWMALGLRSGLWGPAFLLAILLLTLEFAIFYAVSALFGLLTGSPIVAILMASFTWAVLWGIGLFYTYFVEPSRHLQTLYAWVYPTMDAIHFILPRYKDLDLLMSTLLSQEWLGPAHPQRLENESTLAAIGWFESLGFTIGFIALLVGLACWWFARRDY